MIEECCEIASNALDGKFGFTQETLSILLFVIIFNILAKWVLKRLHKRFERQKKIWKDSFVQALYLPLSAYTWFFAAAHAINLIIPKMTDSDLFFRYLHLTLAVGAILAIAWFLLRWKTILIRLVKAKAKINEIEMEQGKIDVIDKVVSIFVFFITSLLLLEVTGGSVNTLIAFGGIGGLALAFASQEVIANYFSGGMIYATRPFSVGDWIKLPEKDLEGHVEEIGWYMTRIRTFEKRPVYVPNSIFSKVVVETPSRMSHRQFKTVVPLKYRDLELVRPVIREVQDMLEGHPEVDCDQRICVNVEAFGTVGLDVVVSAYTLKTDTEEFAQVKQDLLLNIVDILNKNKIEMAAPVTIVEIPDGITLKK